MAKTKPSSSLSCMLLVFLLFLTLEGSYGFVGSGKAKLQKPYGSSYPFSSSHQRKQHPSSTIELRNDRTIIRPTRLDAIPSSIRDVLPALTKSLFSYGGHVPLLQAFALNAFLFAGLRKKLLKMLTPEGLFHSLALGTGLWATLGWRGWTTCVLYLLLGSTVTKVKFKEKEKLGIAEGRGGRRGPENVW